MLTIVAVIAILVVRGSHLCCDPARLGSVSSVRRASRPHQKIFSLLSSSFQSVGGMVTVGESRPRNQA